MNYIGLNRYQILDSIEPGSGEVLKFAEYVGKRIKKSLPQSAKRKSISMAPFATPQSSARGVSKKRARSQPSSGSSRAMSGVRRNPFLEYGPSTRSSGLKPRGRPAPSSGTNRVAIAKRKTKVKTKKPKRVKVSKKFKKMVEQVVTNKEVTGVYQVVHYDAIRHTIANGQTVSRLSKFAGEVFSLRWLNYLASRMFNDKSGPLRAEGEKFVEYGIGDIVEPTKLFNEDTLKVNVISNQLRLNIKSNSHRTYYVTIYMCTPKTQQAFDDPIDLWTDTLATLNGNGTIVNGTNSMINYSGPSINRLYQDPRFWPQFNKYFSCEVQDVIINPGETSLVNFNLPTGMIDFKKCIANDVIQKYNKYGRYLFAKYTCDLCETNQGTEDPPITVKQPSIRAGDTQNIAFEFKMNTKISMPEQTGLVYATGTSLTLNARHDRYCFDYFGGNVNTTQQANLRIDPLNPTVDEAGTLAPFQ